MRIEKKLNIHRYIKRCKTKVRNKYEYKTVQKYFIVLAPSQNKHTPTIMLNLTKDDKIIPKRTRWKK